MDKPRSPGPAVPHPAPQDKRYCCLQPGGPGGGCCPAFGCSAPTQEAQTPHAHPHHTRLGCAGLSWLCPHSHCFPLVSKPRCMTQGK